MPRGVYDRSKKAEAPAPAYIFENTVALDSIDYLLYQAEADELAQAVVNELKPAQRASILACILENRLNRVLMPPPNLAELAEKLLTFAPQPQENPDNAKTGTESA